MVYHLFDKDGEPLAGDSQLGDNMRNRADALGGYIKDMDTDKVIYPSKEQDNV